MNEAAYKSAKAQLDEQIVNSEYPDFGNRYYAVKKMGELGSRTVGGGHTGLGLAMRIPVLEAVAVMKDDNDVHVRREVSKVLADLCPFPNYTKKEKKAERKCFEALKNMTKDTDEEVREKAICGVFSTAVHAKTYGGRKGELADLIYLEDAREAIQRTSPKAGSIEQKYLLELQSYIHELK